MSGVHVQAARRFRMGPGLFLAVAMAYATVLSSTLLFPSVCAGQTASAQRMVQGKVTGADDKPIAGAVVYLKDLKTLNIKSFISTDDGSFRFGQISSDTDYQLWADLQGKKSAVKTISSFDKKKLFNIVLKID